MLFEYFSPAGGPSAYGSGLRHLCLATSFARSAPQCAGHSTPLPRFLDAGSRHSGGKALKEPTRIRRFPRLYKNLVKEAQALVETEVEVHALDGGP